MPGGDNLTISSHFSTATFRFHAISVTYNKSIKATSSTKYVFRYVNHTFDCEASLYKNNSLSHTHTHTHKVHSFILTANKLRNDQVEKL